MINDNCQFSHDSITCTHLQFRITSEGIPSLDLPVDDIALGQIARPHHGAVLEVLATVGLDQLLPGLVLKARNKVRLGFENKMS